MDSEMLLPIGAFLFALGTCYFGELVGGKRGLIMGGVTALGIYLMAESCFFSI